MWIDSNHCQPEWTLGDQRQERSFNHSLILDMDNVMVSTLASQVRVQDNLVLTLLCIFLTMYLVNYNGWPFCLVLSIIGFYGTFEQCVKQQDDVRLET